MTVKKDTKKAVLITNTGVGIKNLNPQILKKQINEIRGVLKGYDNAKPDPKKAE